METSGSSWELGSDEGKDEGKEVFDLAEALPHHWSSWVIGSVGEDMRLRIGLVASVVLLVIAVVAAAVEVSRLRADRDDVRAALAAATSSLAVSNERLSLTTESRVRYLRLADHRREVVDGLRDQVDWDKSHLLDCWTALVRVVPAGTMKEIFGRPLGYLADAARDGGVLAHYVRRCASDAVP